ncbi:MAG: hypothetical protein ABI239_13680 [Aquihabitans sp.]
MTLLCVAVLGIGGPLFYVLATLDGGEVQIPGGFTRMMIELAVGSYALYWSYRLWISTLRTAPSR